MYFSSWTIGLAFILSIGVLIALLFKRRQHPTNLILLSTFVSIKKDELL